MKAKMNKWSGWTNETRPDILMALYRHKLVESGFTIRDDLLLFRAIRLYGFISAFRKPFRNTHIPRRKKDLFGIIILR